MIYHNRWKRNSRLTELASPLSVPSLLLLLVSIDNHNFAPRIDCMHFQLTSILVICELIAAAGREWNWRTRNRVGLLSVGVIENHWIVVRGHGQFLTIHPFRNWRYRPNGGKRKRKWRMGCSAKFAGNRYRAASSSQQTAQMRLVSVTMWRKTKEAVADLGGLVRSSNKLEQTLSDNNGLQYKVLQESLW